LGKAYTYLRIFSRMGASRPLCAFALAILTQADPFFGGGYGGGYGGGGGNSLFSNPLDLLALAALAPKPAPTPAPPTSDILPLLLLTGALNGGQGGGLLGGVFGNGATQYDQNGNPVNPIKNVVLLSGVVSGAVSPLTAAAMDQNPGMTTTDSLVVEGLGNNALTNLLVLNKPQGEGLVESGDNSLFPQYPTQFPGQNNIFGGGGVLPALALASAVGGDNSGGLGALLEFSALNSDTSNSGPYNNGGFYSGPSFNGGYSGGFATAPLNGGFTTGPVYSSYTTPLATAPVYSSYTTPLATPVYSSYTTPLASAPVYSSYTPLATAPVYSGYTTLG